MKASCSILVACALSLVLPSAGAAVERVDPPDFSGPFNIRFTAAEVLDGNLYLAAPPCCFSTAVASPLL